jgi:hypothetical protein
MTVVNIPHDDHTLSVCAIVSTVIQTRTCHQKYLGTVWLAFAWQNKRFLLIPDRWRIEWFFPYFVRCFARCSLFVVRCSMFVDRSMLDVDVRCSSDVRYLMFDVRCLMFDVRSMFDRKRKRFSFIDGRSTVNVKRSTTLYQFIQHYSCA